MCPAIANQPSCTCSAFFKTEDDLERHLDANVEQRRFREQWIQWLQTETRRYQAHARVDSGNHSESDSENSRDNCRNGEPASAEQNGLSRQHLCPSCSRTEPFLTKQKLRRHFEQHVECHEVCVCCTKVFRIVREFRRHAEKCADESKRKMTYMTQTSDELREFSDKQLDIALGKSLPDTGKGRKRTWDEAEMDAGVLGIQAKVNRSDPGASERVNTRQPLAENAAGAPTAETLSSYTVPMSEIGSYIARDSEETACFGPTQIQHQNQSLSVEAAEDHIPSLDILDTFDAPLMQIMNGVPVFTNQWVVDGHDGDASGGNAAMYHLS